MSNREEFQKLLNDIPQATVYAERVANADQERIFAEATKLLAQFIEDMGKNRDTFFLNGTEWRDAADIVAKALHDRKWSVCIRANGSFWDVCADVPQNNPPQEVANNE
jgi:hypothetical protein